MALEGGDQQIGIEADHQGDDETPTAWVTG